VLQVQSEGDKGPILMSPLEDVLGYAKHLSPLLSLLMDAFSSLHHTLRSLPPRSLCGFTSHRVHWTWLGLMPPVMDLLMRPRCSHEGFFPFFPKFFTFALKMRKVMF